MASPRESTSPTGGRHFGAAPPADAGRGPLVATKLLAPPSVSGHRERPRLSGMLDRGLDDRSRLTLLSAPPGYGKTVAVAGWLGSRGLAHAWLSLDQADNDLARFVRYLVAALRAVRPEVGDGTEGLLGPGVSPSIDLLGATLLDEIAASDDPFVLVLDDYHVIGAEPIHQLVRFLIERGPLSFQQIAEGRSPSLSGRRVTDAEISGPTLTTGEAYPGRKGTRCYGVNHDRLRLKARPTRNGSDHRVPSEGRNET